MFLIITSKNEEFGEAADLIALSCDHFSIPVEIIDIDAINTTPPNDVNIIFFLTNDQRVGHLVADFSSKGIEVINSGYLTGNRKKSYAEQQACLAGVNIPRQVADIDLPRFEIKKKNDSLSFPLYIKSENHGRGAFKVENKLNLERIIIKLDSKNTWYAEEAIDIPGCHLLKLYWVAGNCFNRDGNEIPRDDIRLAMNAIGQALFFDVFSADFIINEANYWCIDIDPAPALFGSKNAREYFAQTLLARRDNAKTSH